uniref:WAP domain-containing protein n=1 Tax=Magallana gigas TaxID=29159 RepID=A0A8W8KW56_MAGGI
MDFVVLDDFIFEILVIGIRRSITETREAAGCYTTYVISTTHHECISDSECDTYMSCCQNSGADYSVCVPHKDHVLPKEKSHQSLSSGQKMHHKDKGHVFHLPQPSPIPIPILEKATHKSKS